MTQLWMKKKTKVRKNERIVSERNDKTIRKRISRWWMEYKNRKQERKWWKEE